MKLLAVALNTFREAIRNKILYSLVFFAALVVAIASVLGAVSIGDQTKFIKDFGLMSISLFGMVIAIVLGVNLLSKELEKKTILNILSKPVARWEFISGKFLGLFGTLALVVALMSVGLVGFLMLFEGRIDWGLVLASGTTLLELMVVIAFALFFSAIVVTPTLAGLFTAAMFVVGRSSGYLHYFLDKDHSHSIRVLAQGLYWVVPHLDRFSIADQVVYGDKVDVGYLIAIFAYAVSYSAVLLLLTIALFSRREFT
jgi:ABC-type transport system involved in multi-copper enzyme maturation permease subunit